MRTLTRALVVGALPLVGFGCSGAELPTGLDSEALRAAFEVVGESCIAPTPDLVAWLPGDGDPGDLAGPNAATLTGEMGFGPGLVGDAFLFDGIDDEGNLGNDASLHVSDGDFTLMAWVRFDALGHPPGANAPGVPPGDMAILDKVVPGSNNTDGWRLVKQTDNRFWFCLGGCQWNAPQTIISTTYATVGEWYHVAVTKDAAQITIWINGVAEASKGTPWFVDTHTADLMLGTNVQEWSRMNGAIDEVQVVARAMSAEEIAAVHAAGAAGQCKPAQAPPAPPLPPEPTIEAFAPSPVQCKAKGNGVTPIALLGSEDFDAAGVDPASLRFGASGTEAPEAHGRLHVDDVDGDGDLDALLHFRSAETGIECGDGEARLSGVAGDGYVFDVSVPIRTKG